MGKSIRCCFGVSAVVLVLTMNLIATAIGQPRARSAATWAMPFAPSEFAPLFNKVASEQPAALQPRPLLTARNNCQTVNSVAIRCEYRQDGFSLTVTTPVGTWLDFKAEPTTDKQVANALLVIRTILAVLAPGKMPETISAMIHKLQRVSSAYLGPRSLDLIIFSDRKRSLTPNAGSTIYLNIGGVGDVILPNLEVEDPQ
jgi:hypothetical protein